MRTHTRRHLSHSRRVKGTGSFEDLAGILGNDDGYDRWQARTELVAMGRPAVHRLIELTFSPDDRLRWEATKALVEIRDPEAGDALAERLSDENMEVRWLAAEALIALRSDALIPLLRALQRGFSSVFLREGARHILRALHSEGLLDKKSLMVYEGLRGSDPPVRTALTAHEALMSLLEHQSSGAGH